MEVVGQTRGVHLEPLMEQRGVEPDSLAPAEDSAAIANDFSFADPGGRASPAAPRGNPRSSLRRPLERPWIRR